FFASGGRIRGVPVTIGGTSYIPPLPIETIVIENILEIINRNDEPINIAIELCLYCMKTQIFNDGNKRASVIFANHYLISKAGGLLVIPENHVPEFKKLLINYYEDKDSREIKEFLKQNGHRNFR
ncbi:MAG: Fic family protein, partial [Eubacteriales bacterium]|nr:Fic family protein [Eubacteriales bacterium]